MTVSTMVSTAKKKNKQTKKKNKNKKNSNFFFIFAEAQEKKLRGNLQGSKYHRNCIFYENVPTPLYHVC